VCSFVPRLFDFHPDAVKVPYHHANVDSDEVLFYAGGDFMSRAGSGIGVGSLTLHPSGFVHGPQPGSFERSVAADRTDELAVMLDTFRPLLVTSTARSIAAPDYVRSWVARNEGGEGA
jgi:homogentisate 1,2-dioxygenase